MKDQTTLSQGERDADARNSLEGDRNTSYRLITEPSDGMATIYGLIESAQDSLDMTMYELTDSRVVSLLIAAYQRKVKVRVILDVNREQHSNTPAFEQLNAGGVSVHWAHKCFACTHQKTITIDETTSAIMTLNLTPEDYATSRDFAVLTTSLADIQAIRKTFEGDWGPAADEPRLAPTGENLVWSPRQSREPLTHLIDSAAKTLLISQEEFSDKQIKKHVLEARKRDVQVTLVQENVDGRYTDTLQELKGHGVRIAVYDNPTGYYVHAKTIVADYGTPVAQMFVGSENFSAPSLNENRELGLIFADPACLAGVHDAVMSDYERGRKF